MAQGRVRGDPFMWSEGLRAWLWPHFRSLEKIGKCSGIVVLPSPLLVSTLFKREYYHTFADEVFSFFPEKNMWESIVGVPKKVFFWEVRLKRNLSRVPNDLFVGGKQPKPRLGGGGGGSHLPRSSLSLSRRRRRRDAQGTGGGV